MAIKRTAEDEPSTTAHDLAAAPNTLEGFAVLHQFFRLRRPQWNALVESRRAEIIEKASRAFAAMERREDGHSAIFSQLGHKGDLIVIHFRRGFDDLDTAQLEVGRLALNEFLEPTTSYLSVVEIGLYEATVKLQAELAAKGLKPHSPEWNAAVKDNLEDQRHKLGARLLPQVPDRRYVCFYPMNKRRAGSDNWYSLPIEERQLLMRDHGMIGRRYAGQVTQVISGSIGFDDWEWGVDLFADDPLVFKKLVYEMRFDESSARYAEFGPFYFGIRLAPEELGRILGTPDDR
ncbi:MAG TPA: hydrogen peroxide-dependent heme synthase [Candidatus Binataceae bacterium]|jgi:chlorite dismutase